ncbi:MAG: hypothetical protein ABJB74_04605 [Gemmatimonas sp.]
MKKALLSTLCRATCLAMLFACSDRMVASKDGIDANKRPALAAAAEDSSPAGKLLKLAAAAKTQPLAADASRELEAQIVDEYLKDAPAEFKKRFRDMLQSPFISVIEPEMTGPDSLIVKQKWALDQALMDLRKVRLTAAYLAMNPPIDIRNVLLVQLLFVAELNDRTADAMIFQRPNDASKAYLVVREHKLTARNLYRYVRHVPQVWDSMGKSTGVLRSVAVHLDSIQDVPAAEVPSRYQRIMKNLPSQLVAEIPGIGKGRILAVLAREPTTVTAKSRTPLPGLTPGVWSIIRY